MSGFSDVLLSVTTGVLVAHMYTCTYVSPPTHINNNVLKIFYESFEDAIFDKY